MEFKFYLDRENKEFQLVTPCAAHWTKVLCQGDKLTYITAFYVGKSKKTLITLFAEKTRARKGEII